MRGEMIQTKMWKYVNINTIKYQNIIRLKKLLSFRFVLVRHPETYASLHHHPKDLVKNRNHRLFQKPSTSIPAFSFACFFAQISRRIHRQRAYCITTPATCLLHDGLRMHTRSKVCSCLRNSANATETYNNLRCIRKSLLISTGFQWKYQVTRLRSLIRSSLQNITLVIQQKTMLRWPGIVTPTVPATTASRGTSVEKSGCSIVSNQTESKKWVAKWFHSRELQMLSENGINDLSELKTTFKMTMQISLS